MNNNLEFIKWLCKDSDVYKPTLICNCILFVVLGLAIYFVFNAYGCNFWFFVLSFFELSTLYSFYWLPKEAYERWKELELKKEKIEIEKQRCEYIKEKYPNAYSDYVNQCKGKRPLDSDIASITDKEWQAKENEIVEATKARERLDGLVKAYPLFFTEFSIKISYRHYIRPKGIILPKERNFSELQSLNDVTCESETYKKLREQNNYDDEAIRKLKLKDISSKITEDKEYVDNVYQLSNKEVILLYEKFNSTYSENDLRIEEDKIKEKLKFEDNLIKFYTEIIGFKERDYYMDAFLKSQGVICDKIDYIVSHIKELDDYITYSKASNINNSKKGITDDKIISNVRSCLSSWQRLGNMPYYYFYHYYPKRFTDITDESQKARQLIYDFKDRRSLQYEVGKMLAKKLQDTLDLYDLSRLTMVCVPASTSMKNYFRFELFASSIACPFCNIQNGTYNVSYTSDGEATHLVEGGVRAQYSFDANSLKGKLVILFDDVVTKGNSMSYCKMQLAAAGATVLCAISIGKTYSDYHGNPRKPHPWTGTY